MPTAANPQSVAQRFGFKIEAVGNGEFKTTCPFHNERTPSFRLYPDHMHCLMPETPVLMADLRWGRLGEIKVGDKLLAFDEHSPGGRGFSRHYRVAEVLALAADKQPCVAWELEGGRRIVGTRDHQWLVRSKGQSRSVGWLKGGDPGLSAIIDIASRDIPEDTWLAGYMAGILDGEGSLTMHASRVQLTIAQKPGAVLDFVCETLDRWNIRHSLSVDDRGVGHLQVGGKDGVMRLLAKTRPLRLMRKWDGDSLGQIRQTFGEREQRITRCSDVGLQEIVQIATTTRTFIADGLASHNCFGCGWHGDAIDLARELDKVSYHQAKAELGDAGATPRIDPYAGIRPDGEPRYLPIPGRDLLAWNPKLRDTGRPKGWAKYRPSAVYPYRSASGHLTGIVLRVDGLDGRKITPWLEWSTWCLEPGNETMRRFRPGWCHTKPRRPRPLYGLDLLARRPTAGVILVEGEKCADWLRKFGFLALTWPGGGNAAAHADWAPLKGRRVLAWPDADPLGAQAMTKAGELALSAGAASFRVIEPEPDRPKGWDCADAIGWSRQDFVRWMQQRAAPVAPAAHPSRNEAGEGGESHAGTPLNETGHAAAA